MSCFQERKLRMIQSKRWTAGTYDILQSKNWTTTMISNESSRIMRSRRYFMSCFQERKLRMIQSKRWTAGCFKIKARNYELLEVISR